MNTNIVISIIKSRGRTGEPEKKYKAIAVAENTGQPKDLRNCEKC